MVEQLRKEGLANDNRLMELASEAATEKSLLEDATQDCWHTAARVDKLQMQLGAAQANVRAYKREL